MSERQQEIKVNNNVGKWVECGNTKTLKGTERVHKCVSRVHVQRSIDPRFMHGVCENCGITRIEKIDHVSC